MDSGAISDNVSTDFVDFDEIEASGAEYLIDYNHPLGNAPGSILIGMFASLFDDNLGGVIIAFGLVMLCMLMAKEMLLVAGVVLIFTLGLGYMVMVLLYSRTAIKVDGHGISFPAPFAVSLNFQQERHWTEISAVRFANMIGNSLEDDRILIGFRDNTYVKLDVDGFSRSALKRFVLLINTYRPDIQIRSDFGDLMDEAGDDQDIKQELLSAVSVSPMERAKVGAADAGSRKSALSFTKIWEMELNSRYSTTAYTPLECGDSLQEGGYKVLGQIAFGGLSAIYLAEDENQNNQLVILKESVLPESADDEARDKAVEMFQREARLLCSIRHRNIAQVYDYFVEQDRHYMVLQHLDGRTLRDYVQEFGKQHETTVLRWALELATTLSYLHKLNPPVIHRDITPDNIIIRKDGSVSIIDFGAANNFLGTATCTVVGKSAYIPLEQFQGKARLVSDIYAFGATLFFVLTARDPAPFSVSDPKEAGAFVSEEMNDLVKDCTTVKPESRLTGVEELVDRLAIMQAR